MLMKFSVFLFLIFYQKYWKILKRFHQLCQKHNKWDIFTTDLQFSTAARAPQVWSSLLRCPRDPCSTAYIRQPTYSASEIPNQCVYVCMNQRESWDLTSSIWHNSPGCHATQRTPHRIPGSNPKGGTPQSHKTSSSSSFTSRSLWVTTTACAITQHTGAKRMLCWLALWVEIMYSNVFTHTSAAAAGRGLREGRVPQCRVSLCICRKCEMLAATTMRCQRARLRCSVSVGGACLLLVHPWLAPDSVVALCTDARTNERTRMDGCCESNSQCAHIGV